MINRLKNNAELAMAAYGYYDLIGKKIENNEKKYGDKANKPITLHDILDSTYYDYETQDSSFFNTLKLNGDFTPTQAKNFFENMICLFTSLIQILDSPTLFKDKRTKEYICYNR